ncbi:MAG: ribose-phosphate pyrophosphokinase [Acidobacteriota bacterium]|nr:ribose-phosphate pyrophosphokinase [Acidobacteriota bacterium]MDH3525339.1 ribose-phosphate pyrophosphokinase [Acidobacteriota bacterium]
MTHAELKIFCGRAHPALAAEICDYLGIEVGKLHAENFSDGEIFCQIEENVRGRDVFLVQPITKPVNETLVELLILLDAFRRSSAARVTAVIPYYGYGRQDKKDQPRVAITAKLVANLISGAGAERVLTMDLHALQIQGFFDIPVDHLFAAPVMLEALSAMDIPDLVIVSPDAGGVARARAIAKRVGVGIAIVDKRRTAPNQAEVMNVVGDVEGRNLLIVDDIIDTAGTLVSTIEALKAKGGRRILAAGVHAILSGPALARLEESCVERVLVTNTTPLEDKLAICSKLEPLSVAPLLGEAIRRIHEDSSVSSLFV